MVRPYRSTSTLHVNVGGGVGDGAVHVPQSRQLPVALTYHAYVHSVPATYHHQGQVANIRHALLRSACSRKPLPASCCQMRTTASPVDDVLAISAADGEVVPDAHALEAALLAHVGERLVAAGVLRAVCVGVGWGWGWTQVQAAMQRG
jgi:hypothetical protein